MNNTAAFKKRSTTKQPITGKTIKSHGLYGGLTLTIAFPTPSRIARLISPIDALLYLTEIAVEKIYLNRQGLIL
jgi:hypothetical protein